MTDVSEFTSHLPEKIKYLREGMKSTGRGHTFIVKINDPRRQNIYQNDIFFTNLESGSKKMDPQYIRQEFSKNNRRLEVALSIALFH